MRHGINRLAFETHLAPVWSALPTDKAEHGRFPRPTTTHDGSDLAFGKPYVDIVQYRSRTIGKIDCLELDQRFRMHVAFEIISLRQAF